MSQVDNTNAGQLADPEQSHGFRKGAGAGKRKRSGLPRQTGCSTTGPVTTDQKYSLCWRSTNLDVYASRKG